MIIITNLLCLFRWAKLGACGVILVAFAIFCFIETKDEPERLMSLVGMVTLFILAFICSKHPTRVRSDKVSILYFQTQLFLTSRSTTAPWSSE